MSKIDELIQRLCPKGVAFKRMGEVGEFVRGSGLPKSDFTEKGVGCIHYGQIYTYYSSFAFTTKSFVSPDVAKKLKKVQHGDLIIASTSENIEDVCKTVAWLGEEEIVTGGHATIFKHKENPKYLSYLTQTDLFFNLKKKYAKGIKVTDVSAKDMAKFEIPVPPLEIQNEIVSILDKFTSLEAELEAELEARKTQYEYYRDAFFNSAAQIAEWKPMGEIGHFVRGKRFVKSDIVSKGVPCIHYGEMYTHYNIWAKESKSFLKPELAAKLRVAKMGDVIIVAAGETIEDIGLGVAWLGEEDVVIHDACFAFSSKMDPAYVSHFLQTDLFHSQIKRYISSGKISAINATGLSKAKIPAPSIEEQKRIANILNNFDSLINNISIGLPAEIEARRKQYKYYRNRLLNFKNVANG